MSMEFKALSDFHQNVDILLNPSNDDYQMDGEAPFSLFREDQSIEMLPMPFDEEHEGKFYSHRTSGILPFSSDEDWFEGLRLPGLSCQASSE